MFAYLRDPQWAMQSLLFLLAYWLGHGYFEAQHRPFYIELAAFLFVGYIIHVAVDGLFRRLRCTCS